MKKKTTKFERQRTVTGALFLLPVLLFVAFFVIWPLIQVIILSFTDWNGVSKTYNFIGFSNYENLTSIVGFWDMCKATIIFSVCVTVLTILVSFLVALVLDKKGPWRINRGFMRSLWFFPCLLSGTVVGILWRIMYNYNNGVLNSIVTSITGARRGVNWLESPEFTIYAVVVACVWASMGMCIIVFLAGLQSIDGSIYEAADIDGATPFKQLIHITWPLMAPSVTINVLTTSIAAFKMYELPLNVSNGGPGYSTTLITKEIYSLGFEYAGKAGMGGKGAALSVVLIFIIALISLIELIYMRNREDIY